MAHNGEQFPIFVSFVHVEASFDVDVSEEEKKRIIEKNMFFFVWYPSPKDNNWKVFKMQFIDIYYLVTLFKMHPVQKRKKHYMLNSISVSLKQCKDNQYITASSVYKKYSFNCFFFFF